MSYEEEDTCGKEIYRATQDARLYVYMCSVDAPERVRR